MTKSALNILVINLRYFGDALISASLVTSIKNKWPDATVTYLVFDKVKSILEGVEGIDRIIGVPERPSKWAQLCHLFALNNSFDIAFITQNGTRPLLYGFFAAKKRYGFGGSLSKRNWWKSALLSNAIADTVACRVIAFHRLLQLAGISAPSSYCVPCPHSTTPLPPDIAQCLMGKRVVVLHTTPRYGYKCWTQQGWRQLIEQLHERGLFPVLTGGPSEEEKCGAAALLDNGVPGLSVAGRLSFAQTADLIRQAVLFIGPDTATTHVAAAAGTPTIALFGPTPVETWGPWSPGQSEAYALQTTLYQRRGNVIVIQHHPYQHCPCRRKGCNNVDDSPSLCLQQITSGQILAAADQLLQNNAPEQRG